MPKKILVWLSWGVDSAVTAYLLKKQWYDVTAWFMINYLAPEWEKCSTLEDIEVAKEVAKYLDIPFFTFDFRSEYEEKVLNYMYEWYKKWITPNPDIMCNSEVKFKVFLDEALEAWFDMVATGHYAKITKGSGDIFHLKKWVDQNKDQSYFLAGLNQKQLSKALFPIWDLEKPRVREVALEAGLPNAMRKDSQWICFVWKVNMADFLEKKIKPKPGNIVDTNWKILWIHKWSFYYTIWQRKGLDLWWQPEPVFVVKKDLEKNEVVVWTEKDMDLYDDKLTIKNMHFIGKTDFKFPMKLKCKIRYRQADQDCSLTKTWEKYEVIFNEKQRAIASWQICAFYDGDDLIMSGVIE